jgi:glycosyltransferase involved in cell wall biosynthesis
VRLNLDNVNFSSNSGPNSFAAKLLPHLMREGVEITADRPDAHLCFIESPRSHYDAPMIQRLDGIYFNTRQDFVRQNYNIRRTYEMASGVVFQSHFNKRLISQYFGPHKNYQIIHNGADTEAINKAPEFNLIEYENLWVSAASWRPHKRLGENIRYFLEHSSAKDIMIVAGNVPAEDRIVDDKVRYIGVLTQTQLYSLYKRCQTFVHLAWLDHCPNVVVDARASGCKIVCSSAGGTREIAGPDAIVIEEEEWDLTPVDLYTPPEMNFSNKLDNSRWNVNVEIEKVSSQYCRFIKSVME